MFVLGDSHWTEGPAATIEQNFSKLAREVGPRAAIVVGHEGADLRRQLAKSLERGLDACSETGKKWPVLREFIIDSDRNGSAIVILGVHPDKLSENDLVLYASQEKIRSSFGGMDRFFDDLCEFAMRRNSDFLFHFEEKSRLADKAEIFELKPNIAGIGFNMNEVIRRLEKWWHGQRVNRGL